MTLDRLVVAIDEELMAIAAKIKSLAITNAVSQTKALSLAGQSWQTTPALAPQANKSCVQGAALGGCSRTICA